MEELFDFGKAFSELKIGNKVKLAAWSDDVYISMQVPSENSKMTAPYLYVTSRFGMVPWNMTQIEMFSDEWLLVR